MRPYGERGKTGCKVPGHGGCAICLEKKPPAKRRARREGKKRAKDERE